MDYSLIDITPNKSLTFFFLSEVKQVNTVRDLSTWRWLKSILALRINTMEPSLIRYIGSKTFG